MTAAKAVTPRADAPMPAPRSLTIKGLTPTLPERGRIKIGRKGEVRTSQAGKDWQPPQKLDHFLITTMQRGADGNFVIDAELHKELGEKPKRIPVRLLFDDVTLNFQSRYVAYQGTKMWCTGDGQKASRLNPDGKERHEVACPCPRADMAYKGADKCKINGRLSVLIEKGNVGGVWVFRTTSYNSVVGLMSSLALMKRATGGPLSGLPLDLVVNPKVVVSPENGQNQTIYVVSLEYRGSIEDLERQGIRITEERAQRQIRIEDLEKDARALLSAPTEHPFHDDDDEEVVAEFYPEQAQAAAGATVSAPPETGRLDRLEEAMKTEPKPAAAPAPLAPSAPPPGSPPVQRRVPTKKDGAGSSADWDAFYAQAEADIRSAPNGTWLNGWVGLHVSAVKNMRAKRKDLAELIDGMITAKNDEFALVDHTPPE